MYLFQLKTLLLIDCEDRKIEKCKHSRHICDPPQIRSTFEKISACAYPKQYGNLTNHKLCSTNL